MIADTTREVITVTSNTGKYPPTYGDLFPYVIKEAVPPQTEWRCESFGPWLVTNIDTPAGDEAMRTVDRESTDDRLKSATEKTTSAVSEYHRVSRWQTRTSATEKTTRGSD